MIPGERWMDFKSVSLPHPLLEVAGGHREYQLTFSESYSRGAVKTVSDIKNVSEYFRIYHPAQKPISIDGKHENGKM